MVRTFSFVTLALVALCLLLGVSIAMADDTLPAPQSVPGAVPGPVPAPIPSAIEAIQPDERMFDDSLAAVEDVYEFDFIVTARDEENPEIVTHSDILEI